MPASLHGVAGGYDSPSLCAGERPRSRRLQLGKNADHFLEFPLGCFPPASPAIAAEAGKQKSQARCPLGQLILLRKIGAGEGIRTLDPDLGKVVLYP
jgi:hypothetical protein